MFDELNGVAMSDGIDLANHPEGPACILKTVDGGES